MRYFLDPFGCAKNQVDGENMMALLDQAGWSACDDAGEADLIIVNSCGFIQSAKQESINAVIAWKRRYREKKILLAGCLAERYGRELAESLPEADGLLGSGAWDRVAQAASELTGVPAPSAAALSAAAWGERPLTGFPGSAYIKISEGCDNNCGFCAIPLIRGRLRSRRMDEIAGECAALLGRGVKELCFIGQDLASYGKDFTVSGGTRGAAGESPSPLRLLLDKIAGLRGHFWARLLYLHPDHLPPDILDLMERDERFLPYFDIPFQHASPSVLAAMGRSGSAETYLALLDTIRKRLPSAVIRSTFLVGFPGETEADFERLLDFQHKARFDWLGVFAYSREEGTAACGLKGRVGKKIAVERKARVEEAQGPVSEKQSERFVGRGLEVLVEEKITAGGAGESSADIYLGRLYCHAPEVDGAAVIETGPVSRRGIVPGGLYPCTVTGRAGFDLRVTL
ncbi:MAG: 30S ribosomal protein S12 methylthiotransferase RimO [Treponema sp.]|jgi:ribosomal protein S12 methylthiotransferase|nr:30S ribosomal protein S12 methylthiotransferase RimO [Treponema sp.]